MEKRLIILAVLLLMSACSKDYSKVTVEKDGISIDPVGGDLEHVQILKWKVGAAFKYTVSKGVLVKVRFPRIEPESIRTMAEKYGVDSWIVRVSKDFEGRRKTIGEIYMPMQAPALKRITANTLAHFAIYYAAAAPSPRFENFQCPAFNHRKIIGDADIEDRGINWQRIAVGDFDYGSRDVKLQKFSLKPTTLNAGMTLSGTYIVELAVFSSRDRARKSGYVDYPESVVISGEEDVRVLGCEDSKIPKKDPDDHFDIRKFKFGR